MAPGLSGDEPVAGSDRPTVVAVANRRAALAAMTRRISTHDVHRWVADQLAVIASRGTSR